MLLRSLSAPRVSPELLLIYRRSGRTRVRQQYASISTPARFTGPFARFLSGCPAHTHSGAGDWSDLRAVRTGSESAVPYHCAGLRVLAGAPGQDGRLRTGHRLGVALLGATKPRDRKRHTQVTFVCATWLQRWCWPLDGNGVLVRAGEVGTSQAPQVLVNYLKKLRQFFSLYSRISSTAINMGKLFSAIDTSEQ